MKTTNSNKKKAAVTDHLLNNLTDMDLSAPSRSSETSKNNGRLVARKATKDSRKTGEAKAITIGLS
jgi:hypothetical protein